MAANRSTRRLPTSAPRSRARRAYARATPRRTRGRRLPGPVKDLGAACALRLRPPRPRVASLSAREVATATAPRRCSVSSGHGWTARDSRAASSVTMRPARSSRPLSSSGVYLHYLSLAESSCKHKECDQQTHKVNHRCHVDMRSMLLSFLLSAFLFPLELFLPYHFCISSRFILAASRLVIRLNLLTFLSCKYIQNLLNNRKTCF